MTDQKDQKLDDTAEFDCCQLAAEMARQARQACQGGLAGQAGTPANFITPRAMPARSTCEDCGADIYGGSFDGRCRDCRHRGGE